MDTCLQLRPTNLATLNSLGILYTRRKNYAQAVEFLQKAIALNPKYATARISLGVAYQVMGQAEKAESEYRKAVELAPLLAEAPTHLGQLLFHTGRLAEAEEEFLRAAEIAPSGETYDRLGDIYLRQGDAGRAEQAFARAVSLDRFDSHAHFRLAGLYAARGRPADAVREYEAGLETHPGNAEALAALRQLKIQAPSPASPQQYLPTKQVASATTTK